MGGSFSGGFKVNNKRPHPLSRLNFVLLPLHPTLKNNTPPPAPMRSWETSGGCRVTRLLTGRSNVFLLDNRTSRLLVDTGWSGDRRRLLKRIAASGKPDAVIMTHTHFDHAGNAAIIGERFAPVFIVHESEKEFLESGNSPIPGGTHALTRCISRLGREKVPHWFHVRGVKADLVFGERFDLSVFGFNAYILHTPGHSRGSCCVIVDGRIALVGDTMEGFSGIVFPLWVDDPDTLIVSWKKLLETGCESFLPAHGMTVSREKLQKAYNKHNP
jgi:glyoxylase-like metal-dependent hydrolase (beta-lactamase superfamily II)